MSVGILKLEIPSCEPLTSSQTSNPAQVDHWFEIGTLMRTQTYNATNTNVATAAAIMLLSRNSILPTSVARNTRTAASAVFSQFKCDQSTAILTLRGNRKNRVSVP